jgi:protein phosphatase-4 regulatory subunit 3
MLPNPDLGNLHEIENHMRAANSTPGGREAFAKFIFAEKYIPKLIPLVEMAEDLESVSDLHRLCSIMKMLILLNDSQIIEYIVTDAVVLGVVGALEYDPDFPLHKANHRQYLADESKFKEVVRIEDENIKKKIHYTFRLQYLKDVVLARILDDPTFSVLNSLIFFHQVDIVQHLQANGPFLKELFTIFSPKEQSLQRKKDAVLFIQQCCGIAKSLQANGRAQLYQNFISNGLLEVIQYALKHQDAIVRVAGTEILINLIDHDALMVRSQVFKALQEKTKPLTDTLIELLLIEVDLGVKAQMAEAIKILLDPNANSASIEALGRTNSDFLAKMRGQLPSVPQTDSFIQNFYDDSARKLFQPLKDLEGRDSSKFMHMLSWRPANHLQWTICLCRKYHYTPIFWKSYASSSDNTTFAVNILSCQKVLPRELRSSWIAPRSTCNSSRSSISGS